MVPRVTKTGTPTRSEPPRLSEVARHLVLPTGIVSTGWPAVRAKCRDLGLGFDRWQDGAGRCILAKRDTGLYAAGEGSAVISIARQVGKTYLIGAIVFALCLIYPGLTVLWTAHRVKTGNEVYRQMAGMARRKAIAPFIEQVLRGSGNQSILFRNGSRVVFGARETGFGRGWADVGVLVFDEGQLLGESTLDDMVPATNTAANPLVLIVGTPPKPDDGDLGDVFRNRRNEALSETPDPDVLYIEISADPDCDPTTWAPGFVDWEQVAKANPSYPHRTPASAIRRMLKLLGRASFRREGLGIWDDDVPQTGGVITAGEWADCLDVDSELDGEPTLALDVAPMMTRACIVAAGPAKGSTRTHVEITGAEGVLDYREGTDWAVARLASKPGTTAWIAAGSAAEALRPALEAAGVNVEILPRKDYAASCVSTAAGVIRGDYVHRAQKAFADAVVAGAKRTADEGLWTWGRVKSTADITPLVAMTVAVAAARDDYNVLDSIG